ncbi:MAG: hypothetical protein IJA36_06070 [Lachnospiraceae bacterium]|nr:hypothetical protein [Lachnospiraceae bacterium]
MGISKTGCSRSITKEDLDRSYKQGFMEGVKNIEMIKEEYFLKGIEASRTIKWEYESEEIERVKKEWLQR